jgi:hypothetical protein
MPRSMMREENAKLDLGAALTLSAFDFLSRRCSPVMNHPQQIAFPKKQKNSSETQTGPDPIADDICRLPLQTIMAGY